MTDTTYSTYNRDVEMRENRGQMMNIALLLVLGLIVGTIVAIVLGEQARQRRQQTLRGKLEHGIGEGLESTVDTVRRLEKEFKELRKRVEHGIGDLR